MAFAAGGARDPAVAAVAVLAAVEARLDGVDEALRRLDDGSYAVCARCGAELDRARLDLDPLVRTCYPSCGSAPASSDPSSDPSPTVVAPSSALPPAPA